MSRQLNDPFKRLEVLRIEPIQFSNENVERMRERQRDAANLHRPGPAAPARTGAKTQFESRLQIESALGLVQPGRRDERG